MQELSLGGRHPARDRSLRQPQREEPKELVDLMNLSVDALDTEDEDVDPSFDMDASIKSNSRHMTDTFCEDWVAHLDWEGRASLHLFLCFQLKSILGRETEGAELAALMTGKSDRTI